MNGVRDRSGNVLAPASGIAVGSTLRSVPLASAWRYHDFGVDLETGWREPGYDDSGWPSGLALLYNDASLNLSPQAPTGPWQVVPQPTWPLLLAPTQGARFYRLHGQ